jgi:hypothetical protein
LADTRDIEQLVDQPHHMGQLSVHRVADVGSAVSLGILAQDIQPIAQRRQRIAQLVGQGRQELVLSAVGFPECFGLGRQLVALGVDQQLETRDPGLLRGVVQLSDLIQSLPNGRQGNVVGLPL